MEYSFPFRDILKDIHQINSGYPGYSHEYSCLFLNISLVILNNHMNIHFWFWISLLEKEYSWLFLDIPDAPDPSLPCGRPDCFAMLPKRRNPETTKQEWALTLPPCSSKSRHQKSVHQKKKKSLECKKVTKWRTNENGSLFTGGPRLAGGADRRVISSRKSAQLKLEHYIVFEVKKENWKCRKKLLWGIGRQLNGEIKKQELCQPLFCFAFLAGSESACSLINGFLEF